jgi:hypothetical protein
MMQDACPSCGNAETLEAINEEIRNVREEGKRRDRARARAEREAEARAQGDFAAGDGTAGLSFIDVGANPSVDVLAIGGGICIGASADHHPPEIQADVEISNRKTCAACGTWWRPDAAKQAEILREELLRVTNEVYTPIERMAKLAEDDV